MKAPTIQPEITALNKPWWDGLAEGALKYQACHCGHKWLPPRAECPACLGSDWRWLPASGQATLVSWTVFHVAYHEAFAQQLPYNVCVVELAEGPRLISNVLDAPDGSSLKIGMRLSLSIQQRDQTAIACFRMASDA